MKLIPLTQGQFATVDDGDFGKLIPFSWYAEWRDDIKTFYAARHARKNEGVGRKKVYLHRQVMRNPVGLKVDHKNHNGLDCQKANLRVCTNGQNMMNRRGLNRNSTTGLRGVRWLKEAKKWSAEITYNRQSMYLGIFDTKEGAHKAYCAASRKYFGEFSNI